LTTGYRSWLWAGHPFASLKSPHIQFELDMTGPKLMRSKEPPGYGVILVGPNEIVVNYRDILDCMTLPRRPATPVGAGGSRRM
jgi:hypothetical protein